MMPLAGRILIVALILFTSFALIKAGMCFGEAKGINNSIYKKNVS